MTTIPQIDHAELIRLLKDDFPEVSEKREVRLTDVRVCWQWEKLHLALALVQEEDKMWQKFILKAITATEKRDRDMFATLLSTMEKMAIEA